MQLQSDGSGSWVHLGSSDAGWQLGPLLELVPGGPPRGQP